MRKVFFIFTILIITVLITGNYFIYKQVTKAHKKEFKAFIRSRYAKTQTISISPSELYSNNSRITWLDNNKEVLMNDIMYDIISLKSEGVKVVLTVVEDTQEKELMNKYKEQFDVMYSSSSGKKQNSVAKDFFAFKYLSHENICVDIRESSLYYFIFFDSKTTKGFSNSLTPPPDFL
ncbi:MAG: hypothetical protein J0L69_16030 [Bacteroidetes bacterium]|nr:hypothetical protein [Bacteroidota bacterium]